MVRVCEVFGCTVRDGQGLRLFCFPKNQEQRLIWLSWIKINRPGWTPKTNSRICELHFAANCYETREDGSKILKRTAIPSLQEKFVKNIENTGHSRSLPRRFKTAQSRVKRVSSSKAKNFSEAKKPFVLRDHSYCSTSVSSQMLQSQVSPITNSVVDRKVTKKLKFSDLGSQSRSIKKISSSHSNSVNVSTSTEATRLLLLNPVNSSSSFNVSMLNVEESEIPSRLTEDVSTQTTIDICNNVSLPSDKSVAVITALKKEIAELQRINKIMEEECNKVKKSTEKVYKLYFATKRKYLAHKRKMEYQKKKEK
ncbi:THAP domain-containing protein 5 isoform X1 [Monomorium pharaonis]|uniref:THAP domain-containing protein 5 isoform X1 n=1 Tax=Monomorium pharaonis TaxID=307658 RepID=UPI00063ED5EB|nr:THAP domain-containing protein 5 isoform X1 [Monomorium pharaonis]